jgi:hypothetical protein
MKDKASVVLLIADQSVPMKTAIVVSITERLSPMLFIPSFHQPDARTSLQKIEAMSLLSLLETKFSSHSVPLISTPMIRSKTKIIYIFKDLRLIRQHISRSIISNER